MSLNGRKDLSVGLSCLLILCLAICAVGSAQTLSGTTGSSSEFGSGWLKLASPVNFSKGERLKLSIGGTANKIIVRLLPQGASPDTPVGVITGVFTVPASRIVEVSIPEDRKQVVQISVHGGPNPWNQFPLGPGNGPATITS